MRTLRGHAQKSTSRVPADLIKLTTEISHGSGKHQPPESRGVTRGTEHQDDSTEDPGTTGNKAREKLTLHGFQDTTLGPFLLELLLHTEALEIKKVLTYR